MRWHKEDPKAGDVRVIQKFLFFPKKLKNKRKYNDSVIFTTRWLETAKWIEEYKEYSWSDRGVLVE